MKTGRLPGIIWVLSALVTPGYTLSCRWCGSSSYATIQCSYTSIAILCFDDQKCGSSHTEITGKKMSTMFGRECKGQDDCAFMGNHDLGESQYRVATTCCSTDGCTPPVPTLLPSSDEPNGLECPSCVSNNVTTCNSSHTVTCNRDKICFSVEVKDTTGVTYDILGCARQSYCDHVPHEDTKILNATEIAQSNDICFRGSISVIQTDVPIHSSGGISIQKVVLTPAIVCLLLLKWLF